MKMEINRTEYEITMCSDLDRDGMYLEASIPGSTPLKQIAEIFYSDQTHEFSISCFVQDVPLDLIETLINMGKARLPAQKEQQ